VEQRGRRARRQTSIQTWKVGGNSRHQPAFRQVAGVSPDAVAGVSPDADAGVTSAELVFTAPPQMHVQLNDSSVAVGSETI
jgi:hypothetical protein